MAALRHVLVTYEQELIFISWSRLFKDGCVIQQTKELQGDPTGVTTSPCSDRKTSVQNHNTNARDLPQRHSPAERGSEDGRKQAQKENNPEAVPSAKCDKVLMDIKPCAKEDTGDQSILNETSAPSSLGSQLLNSQTSCSRHPIASSKSCHQTEGS